MTEDINGDGIGEDTYYFSGNHEENWIKFGGFYWRIIRINEDGSVRILYSGTSPDTSDGHIGMLAFNSKNNDPMYAGYMYGTTGSLANNRINTNDSTIKTAVDTWYQNNLLSNYDKYISKTAIYCNDRSVGSGTYNTASTQFDYSGYVRVDSQYVENPSYKCGGTKTGGLFETTQATADKFSASTTGGGNGQLKYPIALMTADELVYAGTSYQMMSDGVDQTDIWYYKNSKGNPIVSDSWWLLTPAYWANKIIDVSNAGGVEAIGSLWDGMVSISLSTRPVISLKSCVKYSSGDGSSSNPYEVTIDDTCASAEN